MSLRKADSLVYDVLYKIVGDDKKDLICLMLNWEKVVGKLLAKRCRIVKITNQIVYITVFDSVWMQELVLLKSRIIKKIEKQLDLKVKNILFMMNDNNYER